jgi:ABC-type uncharacterized transport system ATPase subunit
VADQNAVLRQLEVFLLEEISGVGAQEPFAEMERARLCTQLVGAAPAAVDEALTALATTVRTLASALSHGQRQAVLRDVRRAFVRDDDVPGQS